MHHNVFAKALIVVWLLVAGAATQAQTFDNEITPFLGYRTGGSFDAENRPGSYDISDDESYGLIINFLTRNQAQLEFLYSRQDTVVRFDRAAPNDPVVELELDSYELGGIYEFSGQMVRPYVAGAVGATHARTRSSGSESATYLSGSFGVGIKIRPDDRVGVRLEARFRGIVVSSNTGLFCSTGSGGSGCSVAVGGDIVGQLETFAGLVFRF